MPVPTVSVYGFAAMAGNARTSPAAMAIAAGRSARSRRDSEPLRKPSSKEPLRANRQRDEQREVEHGLRPGGAERNLQQARRDAEHHRGDRGPRNAAEPTDDDDRHQRADPAPVQRRVD